jgi:hypothetical protein
MPACKVYHLYFEIKSVVKLYYKFMQLPVCDRTAL